MITIDNHYFANINYCKYLFNAKNVHFCPEISYHKGWFTNKCTIIGANGTINLSVPLLGGRNQKSVYKDVKIAYDTPWQQQHLRAISSCYGNAPYFSYYQPIFEKILNTRFEKLFELNITIVETLVKLLKIEVKIDFLDAPILAHDVIFSKKYIQENPPLNQQLIKYPQVFEDRRGFVPNLSIIDLLMCMGPQTTRILQVNDRS